MRVGSTIALLFDGNKVKIHIRVRRDHVLYFSRKTNSMPRDNSAIRIETTQHADKYKVGQVVERKGVTLRISLIKKLPGKKGTPDLYEVYGKPVS